jgi:ATP-dependent exoDNAse (exonuclease V) beta subunit
MQNVSTFQVYNASAGSGKTFTLVKEYLKILLQTSNANHFRHILAVTFTNKAAAEMKERVINNLREFSKSDILQNKSVLFKAIEKDFKEKGVLVNDTEIHHRAKRIVHAILQNYSAFNITTIDSFTYRLIRSFALDLGLSVNFDVEMDAKSLLNEAVDQLISKIGEDQALTKLLIDFSLQKTDDDKSWDITRELKDIAQLLLNENDTIHLQQLQEKRIEDFTELKNQLFKQQKIIEKEFTEIGEEGLKIIENLGLNFNDFFRSMLPNHFKNIAYNIEKAKFFEVNTLKSKVENREFYAKSKSIDIKNSIDSIAEQLATLYLYSEKRYQHYSLNKLFLSNLIPLAVLSRINKELDELKEDKNIRLNAEFNQMISKNLQEQPAPYIYERIGEKFKHYFIDEMQDTSVLQWQNIIPLIHNALSQEHSDLLLVGDTKQAIYRWRGSEPEQFLTLAQEGKSKKHNPFFIEKKLKSLDTNYRSFTEVIDFNNGFFQHISQFFSQPEYTTIYSQENRQNFTDKKGGYVQLSFMEKGLSGDEKDSAYAEKVLDIIQNISKENFYLNEICVLTRTKKQGIAIANFLTENNIDIISSETLLLQNSEKINFVIDVLSYLQNHKNKDAKLNLLYFLYSNLKISLDKHTFFEGLINEPIEDFFNKLKAYSIEFDYKIVTQLPLYEGVEYIFRSFNFTEISDAYLQFFLNEVLQFSQKKSTDVNAFLEFWNDKKDKLSIVVPEGNNAVQIMTIHKSKGLEFPVVIFPFDLDIYKDRGSKGWYPIENPSEYNDFETLLINYNKSLGTSGEIGQQLYQSFKSEKELDNFNLLYVTFTRAVEQLYIISEHKKATENPKTSSQFLIDYIQKLQLWNDSQFEYHFGEAKRVSKKPILKENPPQFNQLLSTSWQAHNIAIVANSALLWDTEEGESITYGNLIHEIMAQIITAEDLDGAIEKYVAKGVLKDNEKKFIKNLLNQIISHPELEIYYHKNNSIYNEREIFTQSGGIIIPDRLVINTEKEAIIIDYKTGKLDKKHHLQLQNYGSVIEQLDYKVVKKVLVYVGENIIVEQV